MKPESPPPRAIAGLRSALLAHYDRSARDLPWRRDTDPYRVLVSEIMLQQTRVETVKKYYDDWLERFPTVAALADAGEDEVLKAWEGLGYYRRARNLHRAARLVRERSSSVAPGSADRSADGTSWAYAGIPPTVEGLRGLPGVGEYTAGAVASIAFGERVPAVDGNVRRVLARLLDEPDPRPAWLREHATELVDPERPGDWNQALMELGATVCTPRNPKCAECPLADWCASWAAGTQDDRPAPSTKKTVPSATFVLAIFEYERRFLLQRRPDGGLLAGLWAFPERVLEGTGEMANGRSDHPVGAAWEAEAIAIADQLGLDVVGRMEALPSVRHRFTHLDATYLPLLVTVAPPRAAAVEPSGLRGTARGRPDALRWIAPHDDDEVALPVAQRKVLRAARTRRKPAA